jgi:hypothetical protein
MSRGLPSGDGMARGSPSRPPKRPVAEPQPKPQVCPSCASNEVALTFSTRTTLYLVCRTCEHVWQAGRPPGLITPETWTSMAFRITRRIQGRPFH